MTPLSPSLKQRKRAFRLTILIFGAELQNLLKLFGALVDGSLSKPLAIPVGATAEKVIY